MDAPSPSQQAPAAASSWQTAMIDFLHTRIELIRIEGREAGKIAATKATQLAITIIVALLSWSLLIAGIIGAIHQFTPIKWWMSALGIGALHLIAALIFLARLRQPTPPAFPVTRQEFDKDKQWMQSLKTPRPAQKSQP